MKQLPRIQLRTVFLLFFCAAVGLATYPDLLGALEPAIATAMAIGLLQQIRQIFAWQPTPAEASRELTSGRQFAIGWRFFLVVVISTRLIIGMLVSRGKLALPERVDYFPDLVYHAVLPICMVVVLCNGLARWRSSQPLPSRRQWPTAWLWTFGVALAVVALVDSAMIMYVVHKAVAGIEAAHPVQFQRPGVYPDLAAEFYRPLWLASAAVAALLAAVAVLARSTNRRTSQPRRLAVYTCFAGLLAPPAFLCYWYYTSEFHRLSPDLASVGLAAIWVDWLLGVILVLALAAAVAYQLSTDGRHRALITPDLLQDIDRTALHESTLCLSIIGLHAGYSLTFYLVQAISAWAPLYSWVGYFVLLCNPTSLLSLALLIITFQLGWLRWRNGSAPVRWSITGLSRPAFFRYWAALTLLMVVAVPTLHAFGFIAWLGPLNLLQLFYGR